MRPDVDPLVLPLHAVMCGSCRTLGPHGAHVAQALTEGTDADDPRVVTAFRRYASSTTTRRLGIVVNWGATAPDLGGYVALLPSTEVRRRDPSSAPLGTDARSLAALAHGDVVLFLDSDRAAPVDTARTLLHELAHVLLGHLLPYLRAPNRAAVPARFTLPTSAIEIEAILATLVAARRRGYGGTPALELNRWLQRAQEDDVLQLVDLMRVFEVAERLIAWYRAGPERDAVPAGAQPRMPRSPNGAPPPVLDRFPGPSPEKRPNTLARYVRELEPA